MSLKAGRVGVNPLDVDPVDGHIKSDATSGYTKQEADAKFETQTHAASTYETKSDADALQPKTLEVPIEMLSGTKLTVEGALQALNSEKLSINATLGESAVTDIVADAAVDTNELGNHLYKIGRVVMLALSLSGVNATAWSTDLFIIPEEYRPVTKIQIRDTRADRGYQISDVNGKVKAIANISNAMVNITALWLV